MEMTNPYEQKETKHFWKLAVANGHFSQVDLSLNNFDFKDFKSVSAYGSCFAQYLVRELKRNSKNFVDYELHPKNLKENQLIDFGYSLFSSRTGNIYTSSHLLQEVKFATTKNKNSFLKDDIYEKSGRFFDGYRPNIWPVGVKNEEVIINDRKKHYDCFYKSINECDLFVFTFGLIENWINIETNKILPLVPGVKFGTFDKDKYKWYRETISEVISNVNETIDIITKVNDKINFLFTLSPVPLIATYSSDHILVANSISKSTLRVMLSEVENNNDKVVYFPSYEIVTNPAARSLFFEQNLRSISSW